MKYLKKKIKQFGCLHLWKKGMYIDIQYGKGFLWEYECKECGKTIKRWTGNEPISGILPENPWRVYEKDPYNNMSPPIIHDDN